MTIITQYTFCKLVDRSGLSRCDAFSLDTSVRNNVASIAGVMDKLGT